MEVRDLVERLPLLGGLVTRWVREGRRVVRLLSLESGEAGFGGVVLVVFASDVVVYAGYFLGGFDVRAFLGIFPCRHE